MWEEKRQNIRYIWDNIVSWLQKIKISEEKKGGNKYKTEWLKSQIKWSVWEYHSKVIKNKDKEKLLKNTLEKYKD